MSKPKQSYSYVDEWKSQWDPDLEAIAFNGNSCDPTRVDPQVLQWIKDNCADKPHFVKVINSGAANGRPGLKQKNASSLTVPSPFVREHFRKLGRVTTLENEGRKWKVSFGTPKKDPQWLQGWERVATDNNFKPGDVVVFELVADSHFRFTLFDKDGNIRERSTSTLNDAAAKKEPHCASEESHETPSLSNPDIQPKTRKRPLDIQSAPEPKCGGLDALPAPQERISPHEQIAASPCKARKLHIEDPNPNPGENPSNTIATPHFTSIEEQKSAAAANSQKLQQNQPLDLFAFTFKSKRRPTTEAEKQSALDAAVAHARALTEHHFVAVMSKTQVYSNFHLVLPGPFVTESCFPRSSTKLTLMDGDGKPWEMRSKQNKFAEVAFHRKFWALFALHHLLEEGDVCVFHHTTANIAPSRIVLEVQIFRVVPVPCTATIHDHFEFAHQLETQGTQSSR